MGKRVRAKGDVKIKTFMSVPPCGLCFKAPNGYVPLAGFRSDRAEIAFSPFSGGSQPSHFERGSSLKLLYLRRNSVSHKLRYLFPPNFQKLQHLLEIVCSGNTNLQTCATHRLYLIRRTIESTSVTSVWFLRKIWARGFWSRENHGPNFSTNLLQPLLLNIST